MKEQLLKLKTELKIMVKEIKESKKPESSIYYTHSMYVAFRSKHIAYCLLRGTPMEKIESKYRDPKDGTHEYVKRRADEIVEKVKKGEEYERKEDIRPSGQATVTQPASSSERTFFSKLRQLIS